MRYEKINVKNNQTKTVHTCNVSKSMRLYVRACSRKWKKGEIRGGRKRRWERRTLSLCNNKMQHVILLIWVVIEAKVQVEVQVEVH